MSRSGRQSTWAPGFSRCFDWLSDLAANWPWLNFHPALRDIPSPEIWREVMWPRLRGSGSFGRASGRSANLTGGSHPNGSLPGRSRNPGDGSRQTSASKVHLDFIMPLPYEGQPATVMGSHRGISQRPFISEPFEQSPLYLQPNRATATACSVWGKMDIFLGDRRLLTSPSLVS